MAVGRQSVSNGPGPAITVVTTVAPLLLVFLAVADADREPARVMLETVAQAFGGDMKIAVERFEGSAPTMAALASAARARGATATARVLWREPEGSQVSLDVYLARSDQSTYRVLDFGVQDRAAERGRAIGLVLAALILAPEESRRRPADPPSLSEAIVAPPKVAAATTVDRPSPEDVAAASSSEAPAASRVTASGEMASSAPGLWALEAMMAAGAAFGGSGGGLGGGLGARRIFGERWGARLALQARTGSIPAAQASSLIAGLAGGVFASLRPVSSVLPQWTVGARLDFILGYEMLTHFSNDDAEPVRRGRFLPVTAAWVEAGWRIAPNAMLHVAMGMEVAAGTTHVVVRNIDVARLAPFRAVTELGFRLRF
jgi:hypothetical protein